MSNRANFVSLWPFKEFSHKIICAILVDFANEREVFLQRLHCFGSLVGELQEMEWIGALSIGRHQRKCLHGSYLPPGFYFPSVLPCHASTLCNAREFCIGETVGGIHKGSVHLNIYPCKFVRHANMPKSRVGIGIGYSKYRILAPEPLAAARVWASQPPTPFANRKTPHYKKAQSPGIGLLWRGVHLTTIGAGGLNC